CRRLCRAGPSGAAQYCRHSGGRRCAARTSRAADLVRRRYGRISRELETARPDLPRDIRRALSGDGAGSGRASRREGREGRDRGNSGGAALSVTAASFQYLLGHVLINGSRCPLCSDTDRLCATAANVAMGQKLTFTSKGELNDFLNGDVAKHRRQEQG